MGYIPSPDALRVNQKREKLAMWLGDDALRPSDAEVERPLETKASKAVRYLEEDIAQTS
jgi:hypothetical protein